MVIIYKFAKKIIVLITGSLILVAGIIMLVTPGPAFVVIPAGLAILATEFVFAQRLLAPLKHEIHEGFPTVKKWKMQLITWWHGKKND
jgi:uncharacterized protein (TIGR02611 family)